MLCASMDTQIRECNLLHAESETSLQMAIASGYASFNPTLDTDLHDTMKRADAEMYQKKEKQTGL